jgi:Ribbon-helix-helix protein, copG family
MESVTFKLPRDVVARLEQIARDEDVSVGQIVRLAVERDFHRRDGFKSHARSPERLLTPIRERVRQDFLGAGSWGDLKTRLIDKGYILREAGGGLALHDAITGRFLCRTSEIGFGYPTLMRQFTGPFPGHSHTWLLDRIREVPVYVKT